MRHYQQVHNMLTTGEVARIFNVHPSTVRRWNNRELLKGYRIGPRADRRYRREDIVLIEAMAVKN